MVAAGTAVYTTNEAKKADEEARKLQQQQLDAEKTAVAKQGAETGASESKANEAAAAADEKRRQAAASGTPDQASETLLTGSSGVSNSLLNVGGKRLKKV